MDHIHAIQEIVDTHKDEMPVYVATRVMEACQKLYESRAVVKEVMTITLRLPRSTRPLV